jgi:hypothetical protein
MGDPQAVDVFVRREDAFAALEDAIKDEPDWAGVLYIETIELDEGDVSPDLLPHPHMPSRDRSSRSPAGPSKLERTHSWRAS